MTNAEKLRTLANWLQCFHDPNAGDSGLLRRIAGLLDAVPPETLEAIKTGAWRAVPVEPTKAMQDALAATANQYNPYTRVTGESIYRAMLAAAPAKPEGEG